MVRATAGTLAIAQRRNHHGARDCLQGWLQMSEERRDVIISYGWDYFELPTWQLNIHFKLRQCALISFD